MAYCLHVPHWQARACKGGGGSSRQEGEGDDGLVCSVVWSVGVVWTVVECMV